MFYVRNTTEFIKNATTTSNFVFVVHRGTEIRAGKSLLFTIAISTFRFQNDFRPHLLTQKPPFSESSGLKSVFEKLQFDPDYCGRYAKPQKQNCAFKFLQGGYPLSRMFIQNSYEQNTSSCPMIFISNFSTYVFVPC